MLARMILIFFCIFAMHPATARMYQWQDPATGTTHFSGKPPVWYRTGTGPRVLVFEKGYIIDDTRIELSKDASSEMRIQAIAKAERDLEIARQKAMAAEMLKKNIGEKRAPSEENTPDEIPQETPDAGEDETFVALDDNDNTETKLSPEELTEEEMRDLILQWENLKTLKARQNLNTDN